MKYTLKKRRVSSKDYSFHKSNALGTVVFTEELLFLSPVLNQDVEDCTAFSSVATRANEVPEGNFDPIQFWDDELKSAGVTISNGFDIEVPASVGCEYGFSPLGNPTLRQSKASVYFWVTGGNGFDLFDNIRLAIQKNQRPVMAGMEWYMEYDTPDGIIADNGKNLLGGHCVKIAGWTTKNGVPYLVIQNSWGTSFGDQGKFYIPRALVNKAFSQFGVFYWSDDTNLQVKQLGFLQALLQNVVNLYKTLIAKKAGFPPSHTSLIPQLAQGIFEAEGGEKAFGYHINNPGDIKNFTGNKYVASLGANGIVDGFAQFPDMATGIKACEQLCTDVANNLLRGYPENCTLSQFIEIYGQPPVLSNYVNTVLKYLPRKVASTKLNDLL